MNNKKPLSVYVHATFNGLKSWAERRAFSGRLAEFQKALTAAGIKVFTFDDLEEGGSLVTSRGDSPYADIETLVNAADRIITLNDPANADVSERMVAILTRAKKVLSVFVECSDSSSSYIEARRTLFLGGYETMGDIVKELSTVR
jgi:hypothetical protein